MACADSISGKVLETLRKVEPELHQIENIDDNDAQSESNERTYDLRNMRRRSSDSKNHRFVFFFLRGLEVKILIFLSSKYSRNTQPQRSHSMQQLEREPRQNGVRNVIGSKDALHLGDPNLIAIFAKLDKIQEKEEFERMKLRKAKGKNKKGISRESSTVTTPSTSPLPQTPSPTIVTGDNLHCSTKNQKMLPQALLTSKRPRAETVSSSEEIESYLHVLRSLEESLSEGSSKTEEKSSVALGRQKKETDNEKATRIPLKDVLKKKK